MKKIELWSKSGKSVSLQIAIISIFEHALACEQFKPGFEIAQSKNIFNRAADLFQRSAAVQQGNDTALKLREGTALQFDGAALRDKVQRFLS
jgi:hypothetical protein